MFFTYILYSKDIDKYYIGISRDPEKRLEYHNKGLGGGKRSYTKRTQDWRLVYTKKFDIKSEAHAFERYIKNQKSRDVIERLISR